MGKEENRCKKCYNCGRYDWYYTKTFIYYKKEKIGYCNYYEKIIENTESCEHWKSNGWRKRRLRVLSIKTLNETIAALTEIIDVIKDDIEKRNVHYLIREPLRKESNETKLDKADD